MIRDNRMLDFGRAIQQLRTSQKIALGEVAQLAGVHRTTLQRWEKNQSEPRLAELEALLIALKANAAQKQDLLARLNAPRARVQRQNKIVQIAEDHNLGPLPNGGDLLRAMRMRRGLSIEEVAARMQVSTRTLRRWERAESWPPVETLHRLCQILQAQEEEVTALTLDVFPGGDAGRSASLDTLEEQLRIINEAFRTPEEYKLRELRLLILEAQLWPKAARSTTARRLLAETYTAHAALLSNQDRIAEMRAYATRSVAATSKTLLYEPFWMQAEMFIIYANIWRKDELMAAQGIQQFRRLLPFETSPKSKIGILSWIGQLQIQEGAIESGLKMLKTAQEAAKRTNSEQALLAARINTANQLIKVGRFSEALALIGEVQLPNPDSNAKLCLTRVEAWLGLKEISEATNELTQVSDWIDTFELSYLRERADALAQQL